MSKNETDVLIEFNKIHKKFGDLTVLNEIDLKIQKELDLPNWRWDYTGKGLVLEKGHQDWGVTQTHLEHLKIKNNWIETHTT